MFSKVDHVLNTSDSYYISSATVYRLEANKDALTIDSGGSVYILAHENSTNSFVIKISAVGDASATIAKITASGVAFSPWGLVRQGSSLIVGLNTDTSSVYHFGVVTLDTTTLNQTGHFTNEADLEQDNKMVALRHLTGDKYFSNYFRSDAYGFIIFDTAAGTFETLTESSSLPSISATLAVDVDSS